MAEREFHDRRVYSRGSNFSCTVRISTDGVNWHHARVSDLSSGGMKLTSTVDYEVGQKLLFDLVISSFLSEFECEAKAVVRRKQVLPHENVYGIQFVGLDQSICIRIDEAVRAGRPVMYGAN